MSLDASIATNRFGLGAKPSELKAAGKNPKAWLISQLNASPPISFNHKLPHSSEIANKLNEYRLAKKANKKKSQQNSMLGQQSPMLAKQQQGNNYNRKILRQLSSDTLVQSITSDNSLNWRLLDFFSNHFSVSSSGPVMAALAPTLEREAIAPNLLGRFEQMLIAVEKHPAMLIYLNNEKSIGPNSLIGKKIRKSNKGRGLNENLAREILELHTLGVDGGYQQNDVQELAKTITGWSVARPGKDKESGFKFRSYGHEPGDRRLFGKSYKNTGVRQGEQMLIDIARHPSTANYICSKLAQHFISDNPPQSLINKLTARWHVSQGNIKAVMVELIQASESWHEQSQKFKTPREYVVSTLRMLGMKKLENKYLLGSLQSLGQMPFNAGSPAGYSDQQHDWDGSSALMAKIEWSSMVAARKKANVEKLMKYSFADTLTDRSYRSIIRAESQSQALTLLLLSPEFLRR